jgi:hypothetical protein
MTTIKNYLSLIKFSHTIFALPFAGIGFCIGLLRSSYSGRDLSVPIEFGWDESNVNWWRDSLIKLSLVLFVWYLHEVLQWHLTVMLTGILMLKSKNCRQRDSRRYY